MPWSDTAIVLGHARNHGGLESEKHLLDIAPFGVTHDRAEGVTTESIHVSATELGHEWTLEER